MPAEYSEEYRNHLERKYAISRLGQQYDEPDPEYVIQWIIDNLQERYHKAIEMEIFEPLSQQIDTKMVAEDVYDHQTSVRRLLDRFVDKPHPETYRLRNTRRYITQTGRKRDGDFQIY